LIVVAFVLGLVGGSALNFIAYRLPRSTRFFSRPRCTICGAPLGWRELIPLIGFAWQLGRCRYCGKRLPVSFLAVELGTAAAFVLAILDYGLTPRFFAIAFFVLVLVAILVLDWRHHLIFSLIIYPAGVVALALAFVVPGGSLVSSLSGAVFGGFLFFLMYVLAVAIYKVRGLGFGDVLLAGLIGLMVGFPSVIAPLFLGCLLAGLGGIIMLLARVKSRKDFIPLGSFLCLGTLLVLLLREPLWQALPLGLLVTMVDIPRLWLQHVIEGVFLH
jgi:leader peptidase (prepilin peptidase) / N-methyltransferase